MICTGGRKGHGTKAKRKAAQKAVKRRPALSCPPAKEKPVQLNTVIKNRPS